MALLHASFDAGERTMDSGPLRPPRISLPLQWRSGARREYYLRGATVVLHCSRGIRTTIEGVRHYTTKQIKDGTMFTCVHCEHHVTTIPLKPWLDRTRDPRIRART